MARTQSETYFEKLCAELCIPLERIPESSGKTPDYKLTLDNLTIITEIKEIIRNKEERESDRMLQERGYGNALSSTPGDRVRKKISEASPQIKALSNGICPSLLVLFDQGREASHLDPYHIRVAMYGLEQIHIVVSHDSLVSPYATGKSFGPKRKMTKEHNTSISALGVLFATHPDKLHLHVYHNKYASVPLQPELFTKYGVPQFKLGEETAGMNAQWQAVEPTASP